MPAAPDLSFIDSLDPNNPDAINEDGMRVWNVRCRLPFTAPAPVLLGGFDLADEVQRSKDALDLRDVYGDDDDKEERVFDDEIGLDPNATGDLGDNDEGELIQGISSSTSVDFFGTEMSLRALKLMAMQMAATNGIPYLPRHNLGLMGAIEWDMVIGRTVHAEVVPVESVVKAHNELESQFILRTSIKLISIPDGSMSELSDAEKAAKELSKRIGRGEVIGQSIGGWFTALQVMQNDDGDVERIIVLGVELDHLAVTRAPANPDASGIHSLRAKLQSHLAPVANAEHVVINGDPIAAATIRDMMTGNHAPAIGTIEDGLADPIAVTHTEHTTICQYAKLGATPVDAELIGEPGGHPDERHIISAAETDGTVVYQYLKAGAEPGDVSDDELVGGRIGEPAGDDESRAAAGDDEDDKRSPGEGQTATEHAAGHSIEPMCAKSDEDRGRVTLSWDADPTPEAVRSAVKAITDGELGDQVRSALQVAMADEPEPEAGEADGDTIDELDRGTATEQSVPEASDARGSAPPVKTTTLSPGESAEGTSTENDMPSLEELSALLDDKLNPVIERVQALEGGGEPPPAATQEPTVDQRVADAEARALAAEEARAETERTMASVLMEPMRVGRAAGALSIPTGPAARQGYEGIVARVREAGTCQRTVAVAQELITLVSDDIPRDRDGHAIPAARVKGQLERGLAALINAAVDDGTLIPPQQRAAWGQ